MKIIGLLIIVFFWAASALAFEGDQDLAEMQERIVEAMTEAEVEKEAITPPREQANLAKEQLVFNPQTRIYEPVRDHALPEDITDRQSDLWHVAAEIEDTEVNFDEEMAEVEIETSLDIAAEKAKTISATNSP